MKTSFLKPLAPALPYLAWIISFALTILDWIALRALIRTGVIEVLATIPTEQRVERRLHPHLIIPAVDQIAVLVLGVVALGLVFVIEHVYRTAADQRKLRKRFLFVTGLQASVYILCLIVVLVLEVF